MAFMIPVVRNDWDVWMGSGKSRPSGKASRSGQTGESRSDETSLSITPNPNVLTESSHRKRSLAIEIRNQQHLRISGGSLPSSFQSAHLTLPLSGASPRYRRPRSSTPRFHTVHSAYRIGNNRASEPESLLSPVKAGDDVVAVSLPVSSEETSPPTKVGSQSSLQKFHNRLVDRLRRSLRLHSSSPSDIGDHCDGENGTRASS